jgi:hypothetical protein
MQGLWIVYSVLYLPFLLLVNSLGTLYQQIIYECNFVVMSDNFDAVYIYFMAVRHKEKLLHWIQPICKIIKLSLCIEDYPRRRLISSYQDIFFVIQDRKCTHAVTLWCICVTTVTVGTQQCSLSCWGTCHYHLYENIECCTTMLLWLIYITGNNKMHIVLHVKCPLLPWNKRMFICSWPFLDVQFC